MSKRNDWLTIMTIVLMMVTSVTGILSWNLSCSYEITNLYGQTVKMYGCWSNDDSARYMPVIVRL